MPRTPALMIQGTGSHVGKSLLVAGLCRVFARRGMAVSPFKPQNMSNNAAVAADGGEIGRAQALQARAAGRPASVHMNPVLLKPENETGAQVVIQGRRRASMKAGEYQKRKGDLLPEVMESFGIVASRADIVVVEGAGSPAEINLRTGDIANMGFAEAADLPVVLVGDIDRGGVIASLVGTHAVLPDEERRRIRGFVVNKFRGDPALFRKGIEAISSLTGWEGLGVVRWFEAARLLPAEDVLGLDASKARDGAFRIAVPLLPRIANFDDLDPLRQEPGVSVVPVRPGSAIPVADLVILPGSKSTIADLIFFREQGWDIDLLAHRRRGGRILGICGGYQMLGRSIADRLGVEGPPGEVAGLGLLDVQTELAAEKSTRHVRAQHAASGLPVQGYEIHVGRSEGPDRARPFLAIDARTDGAASPDGRVMGTYVHGLFSDDAFRRCFIELLGGKGSELAFEAGIDATLDRLADHLETSLPIDRLLALARERR